MSLLIFDLYELPVSRNSLVFSDSAWSKILIISQLKRWLSLIVWCEIKQIPSCLLTASGCLWMRSATLACKARGKSTKNKKRIVRLLISRMRETRGLHLSLSSPPPHHHCHLGFQQFPCMVLFKTACLLNSLQSRMSFQPSVEIPYQFCSLLHSTVWFHQPHSEQWQFSTWDLHSFNFNYILLILYCTIGLYIYLQVYILCFASGEAELIG